ncbi:uncharacterized protein Tco025E_09482 [Trypanosoma conorhini]|uniref:Uncharacterized protein n=1 Tax=Trypanosoma conorhini TaxID=83891 RepID=A0A422MVY1_9TRYP|nr:uncharacterized protein Tco025E_09482 [Trypanosoma conorhini]RNE97346.1 hypothetical protein Tco025E_09482 [Trypanosoma conorhini]
MATLLSALLPALGLRVVVVVIPSAALSAAAVGEAAVSTDGVVVSRGPPVDGSRLPVGPAAVPGCSPTAVDAPFPARAPAAPPSCWGFAGDDCCCGDVCVPAAPDCTCVAV